MYKKFKKKLKFEVRENKANQIIKEKNVFIMRHNFVTNILFTLLWPLSGKVNGSH